MFGERGEQRSVAADDAWLEMTLEELGAAGKLAAVPVEAGSVGHRARRRREVVGREVWVGAAVVALGLLGVALVVWHGGLRETPATPATPAAIPRSTVDVLILEGGPRFEYRYAENALLRASPGVRVQTFLLGVGSGFEQAHSPDLPPLTALPSPAEFARYDVVVLGDVTPAAIERAGMAPAAFASAVVDFVAGGGGLAVIAGAQGMPAQWRHSALFEVLPLAEVGEVATSAAARLRDLEVTAAGAQHPVLAVGERGFDPEPWRDLEVAGALAATVRPGAEVLLRVPGTPERVVLVAGTAGRGRVFVVGVDDLWRLRTHPEVYDRFYRNLVTWLAAK